MTTNAATSPRPDAMPRPTHKWWPLVAVSLGTSMLLIDVTIVNVALPDMAVSLSTSFSALQWVVDAYALALAALLLGIGALADLRGHRTSYLIGLVVFAGSSLVCGLTTDAGLLIAARAVQGVGGAAMFATTFALLNSSYQGRDRGTAYGLWGAVAGASAAIGPILGGLLVEGLSWRWIFFVNLPVCVAAILLVLRSLPSDEGRHTGRVDVAGTLSFTASVSILTYALIRAADSGWGSGLTWSLLVLSALALVAFVLIEQRVAGPLLDLGLFRSAPFVGTMLAALLLNFAAFATFTYTSIWLQTVLGLSPLQAGLTGLPLAVAAFVAAAMTGKVLQKVAPGPVIGAGMLLIGLGSTITTLLLRDGSSWPVLVPGFIVAGVGVGLATPTLSSAAMSSVPVQRGGMAAGAVNTARQLGFAIGIAVQTSLADAGQTGAGGVARQLAGGQSQGLLARAGSGRDALDHALHVASISGLRGAFLGAGVLGLLAGAAVLALMRRPAPEPAPARG